MPIVATTAGELADAERRILSGGRSLALVPTMGALHEGHRSLIRLARSVCDEVAVSIFVNPLQFGPGEDLARYPRTLDADVTACEQEGAALIFAPAPEVMYPAEPVVTVDPGRMGTVLEGAHRPGHFGGMLTVVLKLFNLLRPDVAVFGRKDAQQFALVRRMADDLNLPVRVLAGETVREPDGLALSSRNRYLNEGERRTALALSRALFAGQVAAGGPAAVRAAADKELAAALAADPPLEPDYLALVAPSTFAEVDDASTGEALLAIAARVGTTRLIDNVTVHLS